MLNLHSIRTVKQMQKFLKVEEKFTLSATNKEELYNWLNQLLMGVKYNKLSKKKKTIVLQFIKKVTDYSNVQIKRLIKKYKNGKLQWINWQKITFKKVYDHKDIELLHDLDKDLGMSGKATRKILKREYEVFGDEKYKKLANISASHIYNLRNAKSYKILGGIVFDKTKSTAVKIAERMKPKPNGIPGYFRIDTVHQGDKNGKKGIYHINFVDEVLQFEFVFSVPAISEKYMKQVLELLYTHCPYKIINFHSDNGSEYINKHVAEWLQNLHIKQTKSRSRKHNDNALVESKNGSVIRKHMGYFHIPANEYNANIINKFYINWFIPFLNYHRPCAYPEISIDKKGKQKKQYKDKDYDTPYERLKAIPDADIYLRRDVTFDKLNKIAYNESDTKFIKKMNIMKQKMFNSLKLKS